MSIIRILFKCLLSPRLYKIYDTGPIDKLYEPRNLERWGDQILTSFTLMWSFSLYAIPFVATFMYRRSYPLADQICSLTKVAAGAGVILFASLVARGYSRATNPVYIKFVQTLNKAKARYDSESKRQLLQYDFEFWAWPVDFDFPKEIRDRDLKKALHRMDRNESARRQGELLMALPCRLVSYVVAHTFAVKLMYPGCISILNYAMASTLLQGRVDLIKRGGTRSKLATVDGNYIDTMFVDQRNKSTHGNTLVVACEGNCGFYEIGILGTPLSKGYSVLGWNHPGFGGSTGLPYPSQEQNGIDCVMGFAIHRLGFLESQIILYGWSIGGYTATWAAMHYPSVSSVVLDATFDDVLPLAISRMPRPLERLVRTTVREHLNLNIAEQLVRYHGPVLLIRRTEDEMVCAVTESSENNSGTDNVDENNVTWNRGNHLLAKLLARRYPHVLQSTPEVSLLRKFLSVASPHARRSILEQAGVNDEECIAMIKNYLTARGNVVTYPSDLGESCELSDRLKLTLFLATKYMKDQHSQHCTPLVKELFHPGWDPATLTKST
ncbi:phosphatidylserine lipase ABHD16A [Neodiprion fabricii]|uniref:phosphatidylserine lipase ABHD16A n=1 Tax=Neodiprion fabricii TaxID=2872261 RepID=UPI001ED9825F|nr:phosphatidylserine lipase ABHD16A [Neodiprion fabricii]